MRLLVLTLLLAAPAAWAQPVPAGSDDQPVSPPTGTVESSKIRLDAHDDVGALADAETALAHGGGADAYAARADAERALGRPLFQVLQDYAAAAKLDPRYIEKYNGLIAQQYSEKHPNTKNPGGKGLNGVPIAGILATASIGGLFLGIAVVMLNARKSEVDAPDDEFVKAGGRANGADAEPPKRPDTPAA